MSSLRDQESRQLRRSLALVILFAAMVNYPCLIWGLQSGGDRDVHLSYLRAFEEQLRQGDFYPQWLNSLNYGAGSPIFFVQYPLPYYASAAIRKVFLLPDNLSGDVRAIGIFLFLSGILMGCFTWLWCRRITDDRSSLLATMVALTMPYAYGFDLYYRGAIGEYWALSWIPLALYFAHDFEKRPLPAVAGVAISYAAILLAHPFSALLFAPFLVLYSACVVSGKARILAVFRSGCAVVFGMCLSAFYFLPMFVHRLDFNMANLVRLHTGNFYYQHQLFPFGSTLFPSFRPRWVAYTAACIALALSIIAVLAFRLWQRTGSSAWKIFAAVLILTLALVALAPAFDAIGFHPHPEEADPNVVSIRSRVFLITFLTLEVGLLSFAFLPSRLTALPYFFAGSCLLCFFLTTRWSEGLWHRVTLLWNLQFPWRFDGLLTVFSVGLIALFLHQVRGLSGRWPFRIMLLCGAFWFVFGVGMDFALGIGKVFAHRIPVAAGAPELEIGFPTYTNVERLPSQDELGPSDKISTGAMVVRGQGSASLAAISPRTKLLSADCLDDCTVLVRQLYFPYWRAVDSDVSLVRLEPSSRAGLIEVSLSRGRHLVKIELLRGRSEIIGLWLSCASLLAWIGLLVFAAKSRQTA